MKTVTSQAISKSHPLVFDSMVPLKQQGFYLCWIAVVIDDDWGLGPEEALESSIAQCMRMISRLPEDHEVCIQFVSGASGRDSK